MTADESTRLLTSAWNTLAAGYTSQLVPRFEGWYKDAVEALPDLPEGQIWVPTCGPAKEFIKIARTDLEKAEISDRASVEVADCASVPLHLSQLAGIVSVLGLMILPQPQETIGHYVEALAPGGAAAVLFFPGPEHQTDRTFLDILKLPYKHLSAPAANPWEEALVRQVTQHGGEVVSDTYITHNMSFDSLTNLFEVMATSIAPLEVLRRQIGEEGMQKARTEFVEEHGSLRGLFTISPCARLLVIRKKQILAGQEICVADASADRNMKHHEQEEARVA